MYHTVVFFSSKTINQGCEMSPCQIVIEEHNWFLLWFFFIGIVVSIFLFPFESRWLLWLYMYVCMCTCQYPWSHQVWHIQQFPLSFSFVLFRSWFWVWFLIFFTRNAQVHSNFFWFPFLMFTPSWSERNPLLLFLVFRLPLSKCCTTRPYQSFKSPDILSSFFSEQGRTWSLKC